MTLALIATARTAAGEPDVVAAPEDASGELVPDDEGPPWLWLPRVVLLPLRVTSQVVFAPLRGGAWLFERYQLRERVVQLLFSDDGTLGLYPTAFFETGLGVNVGAHLVDSDLLGHGESVVLSAGYGGRLKQRYEASLASGRLLGATTVSAAASFRASNLYNYFGIGNAGGAVQTRFAQRAWHGELVASHPIAGPVSAQVVAAYTARSFDPFADAEGAMHTGDAFDPGMLVGFAHGTRSAYGELALGLDTTAYASRYIPRSTPSSGWLASGFVGATRGRADRAYRYLRYGVDARRFIDLYRGDRVLVLRAALEGVTARADEVPVVELPRLGGADLLRGFDSDRFRDRVAALASAEYRYPVQDGVIAFGFVDAGRVAGELRQLGVDGWHLGGGGGFQFQTMTSFLLRAQVAWSREGTFLQLALDPSSDAGAKHRRL